MRPKIVDIIAKYIHDQMWAKWAEYQMKNSTPENTERWKRQIAASYEELSEEEKDKDRKFAVELLNLMTGHFCDGTPKAEEECRPVAHCGDCGQATSPRAFLSYLLDKMAEKPVEEWTDEEWEDIPTKCWRASHIYTMEDMMRLEASRKK